MSNTPFAESLSSDPVEQAIARKVHRILNDTTLDRRQREDLVRKAQRELIAHRQQQSQQQSLRQQVAAMKLPQGYQAHSVAVSDGRIQLSGLNRRQGFVWLDAGKAPEGVACNQSPFQLARRAKAGRAVRKDLTQSLAERQKALGYASKAPCA